jgi:CubicO group peptidase (beta-lactamase class C family)
MSQRLDDLIREPVDRGTLPHLYAAVLKDGNLIYEGCAGDTARNRIYHIASMTKPVTTVACMQLVEQEKISLDAPVTDYLEISGPEV